MADRVLGVLGVIGGGFLLLGFLPPAIPWTPDLFNLRLVAYGIGAIAVVLAVHRHLVDRASALVWSATIPAVATHAFYTVRILLAVSQPGEIGPRDYGPGFDLIAIVMWLADAWFGLVAARLALGSLDRWGGVALAVGSPMALLGISWLGLVHGPYAAIFTPLALTGVFLNGLGWVLLGFALIRQASKAYRSSLPVHGLPSP